MKKLTDYPECCSYCGKWTLNPIVFECDIRSKELVFIGRWCDRHDTWWKRMFSSVPSGFWSHTLTLTSLLLATILVVRFPLSTLVSFLIIILLGFITGAYVVVKEGFDHLLKRFNGSRFN